MRKTLMCHDNVNPSLNKVIPLVNYTQVEKMTISKKTLINKIVTVKFKKQ